jgi:hypothetical protein
VGEWGLQVRLFEHRRQEDEAVEGERAEVKPGSIRDGRWTGRGATVGRHELSVVGEEMEKAKPGR